VTATRALFDEHLIPLPQQLKISGARHASYGLDEASHAVSRDVLRHSQLGRQLRCRRTVTEREDERERVRKSSVATGAERLRDVVIGVHRLAEQDYLGHAIGNNLLHLAYDVGESPAALSSARVRDDAVRASIVATALNGDPRLHAIEALRLKVLVMLLEVEAS